MRPPRLLPLTILLLALLLGAKSAVLAHAAAAADAATPAAPPAPLPPQAPPSRAQQVTNWDATPPMPAQCRPDPALIPGDLSVLTALKARKEALDTEAAALDKRKALLDATDAALGRKLAALQQVQARLEALQAAARKSSDDRWTALVSTYEAMAPADAARIFNGLDMTVLLPVLTRMNNRKAAPILAAMDADKARAATDLLAGQAPGLPAPSLPAPTLAAPTLAPSGGS